MGHDVHFLQRLDRVSDAHVELALTLYRDEPLLREVLSRAGLPEGAERLAISLDDPVEGPFVVVTRAGRFVTCLGRGMRIDRDPVPVLTRDRLDAAAARVQRMRDELAHTKRLREDGADGIAARAFERMQRDGLAFPREEMETLLSVQPLIARDCAISLVHYQHFVREHRGRVAYFRFDRLTKLQREFAIAYSRVAYSMTHFLVLTEHPTMHAVIESLSQDPELSIDPDLRARQMHVAFDLGTFPHAYRALWGLARRPKLALRYLKALEPDLRFHWCAFREMGLGVVAAASQKLRAEALKALTRRSSERASGVLTAAHSLSASLGDIAQAFIADPAKADDYHVAMGKLTAARLRTRQERPDQDVIDAVPDEVARAVAGTLLASWLERDDGHLLTLVNTAIPWLARARPEELYLPAAWADIARPQVEDELYSFVPPYAESSFLARPRPAVRATAKVGRNDPCPCGSGKKHKRCCATRRAAC